jgi:hypothetical protein
VAVEDDLVSKILGIPGIKARERSGLTKRWIGETYDLKSHASNSSENLETDEVTRRAVWQQYREQTSSNCGYG